MRRELQVGGRKYARNQGILQGGTENRRGAAGRWSMHARRRLRQGRKHLWVHGLGPVLQLPVHRGVPDQHKLWGRLSNQPRYLQLRLSAMGWWCKLLSGRWSGVGEYVLGCGRQGLVSICQRSRPSFSTLPELVLWPGESRERQLHRNTRSTKRDTHSGYDELDRRRYSHHRDEHHRQPRVRGSFEASEKPSEQMTGLAGPALQRARKYSPSSCF